jgi:hypothetical protein
MSTPKLAIASIVLALCSVAMVGQTTGKTRNAGNPNSVMSNRLKNELDQLYATAKRYSTSLTKITCAEKIHSEQNTSQTGFVMRPVHWNMDTIGEFTLKKSPTGSGRFQDSRVYFEQDGKPVSKDKKIGHPYLLSDAFSPPVLDYFAPDSRACLTFSWSPGRIDFKTRPGMGGHGICAHIVPDAKGYVIFDSVTHTVSHFERTAPPEAERTGGFTPYGTVDYMPYGFRGELYMLPSRITATKQGPITYTFEGTYTRCIIFKASVTMRDSDGNIIPIP